MNTTFALFATSYLQPKESFVITTPRSIKYSVYREKNMPVMFVRNQSIGGAPAPFLEIRFCSKT